VRMMASRGRIAPREGQEAGRGGIPGAGDLRRVDPQLGLGVGRERVMGGQLLGHLLGQAGVGPFALYRPASSASSALGVSASSRRSSRSSARSESR
jgi:hypothetical protein